jgi:hypothetical protein
MYKQKGLEKIVFVGVKDENSKIRIRSHWSDERIRGIRIRIKMSRIHNTGSNLHVLITSNPTYPKVSFVF